MGWNKYVLHVGIIETGSDALSRCSVELAALSFSVRASQDKVLRQKLAFCRGREHIACDVGVCKIMLHSCNSKGY